MACRRCGLFCSTFHLCARTGRCLLSGQVRLTQCSLNDGCQRWHLHILRLLLFRERWRWQHTRRCFLERLTRTHILFVRFRSLLAQVCDFKLSPAHTLFGLLTAHTQVLDGGAFALLDGL